MAPISPLIDVNFNDSLLDFFTVRKLEWDLLTTPLEKKEFEQRYRKYVLRRIFIYARQAMKNKYLHHTFQLTTLIGAALVTIIVSIPEVPRVFSILISGIVTISTVVANYFKFGERSRDFYQIAEDLALEYNLFETKREQYESKENNDIFVLFMDKIEFLIKNHSKKSNMLEDVLTMKKKEGI